MAVMSTSERQAVSADYQRDVCEVRGSFAGLTKADLQAAVNAIDAWIDDNTASFNTSIPQPARNALTAQQKSDLFLRVLKRRVKGN